MSVLTRALGILATEIRDRVHVERSEQGLPVVRLRREPKNQGSGAASPTNGGVGIESPAAPSSTEPHADSCAEGGPPPAARVANEEPTADPYSEPIAPPQINLVIDRLPHATWHQAQNGTRLGVKPEPIIRRGDKVFAIGSCFAHNIRVVLHDKGFVTLPWYRDLKIDDNRQRAGSFRMINFYDTFCIRQEFERMLTPDPAGYPYLPVKPGAFVWNEKKRTGPVAARWQDPQRHGVIATDEEAMVDLIRKIDEMTRSALEAADVFVITLGLIEAWRDRVTGHHVWSAKVQQVSPEPDRFEFHLSNFQENYENVRAVCRMIKDKYPHKRIVLTVSPVGLQRTFTDNDINVANVYSKSVLRAVAGAIDLEFDNVTYWPSYEIALKINMYREDRLHVHQAGVDFIMSRFLEAHGPDAGGG